MKVRDIDRNQKVKIGMKDGCGYIYAGIMGNAPFYKLDKYIMDGLWQSLHTEVKRIKSRASGRKRQTLVSVQKLKQVNDEIVNFIPLADREIREMWDSDAEDGVKAVLVDGSTSGKMWLVDETPKEIDIAHDEGLINLVGAMYREVTVRLVDAYVRMFSREDSAKEIALAAARGAEMEVPSGIIRKCRQIATQKVCFDDYGRMIRPPRKVYEIICKKMGDEVTGAETVLPSTYAVDLSFDTDTENAHGSIVCYRYGEYA